jgi:probable HAF family extracellular repeat protein
MCAVNGVALQTHAAGSFAFTILDVPGAVETSARGINTAGEIVGYFRDAGGHYHGFVRAATGAFTTVDIPGAIDTVLNGINDAGQTVQ